MRLLGGPVWLNLRPGERSLKLFWTTTSKFGRRRFLEACAPLCELLGEGRISPTFSSRFPILEAVVPKELLESGLVVRHLVLLAQE